MKRGFGTVGVIGPGFAFALVSASLVFGSLAAGCDASFTDLREEPPARSEDAGGRVGGDVGGGLGGDAGGTGDLDGGAVTGTETVIASGTFSGRSGDMGSGTASLVQTESGALELRFASNFSVTRVPAPIVYLSSRDTLGRSPNASTDLNLGRLQNSSGAQTYAVPGTDEGRRYAWIWCQSFAVEIARAQLVEVP